MTYRPHAKENFEISKFSSRKPLTPKGERGPEGFRRRGRQLAAAGVAALALFTLAILATGLSRATLDAPDPTVLLRDRHGRFLGETGGDDATGHGYWPVAELPPRVVAATLAAEDRRFWRHPGVDARAVLRAVWQNVSSGEQVSGASTVAMQVARMQRPGERTYLRKATEAVTALALTRRHGREAVLRHYLRRVPYGNQIHGIAYAARRYLDKPVADLSWAEVAFLAAIPQAPARANPFTPRGRRRAAERGRWILDLLLAGGELSASEHQLAVEQIRELRVPYRTRRPEDAMHAVLAKARTFEKPEHLAAIADHPVVTTTLDLDLQREVSWMVFQRLWQWQDRGAGNAAVIVLDRETREVLAWDRPATSTTPAPAPSTTPGCRGPRARRSSPFSTPRPWSAAPSPRPPSSTTSAAAPAASATPTGASWGRCCRASPWPTPATCRRRTCWRASASTRATASSAAWGSTTTRCRRTATASASPSAVCR